MNWILNLATRTKLFLGFGLMIVFLGILIATAYSAIAGIRESQHRLFDRDFIIVEDLLQLRADLNRQRADIEQMMLTTNHADQERTEKDINDRANEAGKIVQKLFTVNQNDPEFTRQLEELESIRKEYQQTREEQIRLIYDTKVAEAQKLSIGIQSDRYEKIRAKQIDLVKYAKEKARDAVVVSEQKASDATRLFIIIGVIALVAGLTMTLSLNRIISGPLKEISGIAERIAGGDLTVSVLFSHRTDEVGLLARNFGRMSANLRDQIRSLSDGVNVLSSSANQISTSTTQFAAGAAETATAVSQTTNTVEEVWQTAQLSSQKAKLVSETAQKTAQISQSGSKSTEETIAGMGRIRQQMESIAESMVRLSEQTQTIGTIVATVEDLAAQSNILAVNASIEAAKAGEQGKGFAVVAQEVRSLAEQSKQATNQVRNILNDIQRATNSAVMATEKGTKAVEAGVAQSSQAGQSIRSLSNSVSESAQVATQIAASSQQQLVGVDQVASAMESIKQASTLNVASAKQLEAAAHNLKELGEKLKQTVQRYRI